MMKMAEKMNKDESILKMMKTDEDDEKYDENDAVPM